jgi:hypothetical protein
MQSLNEGERAAQMPRNTPFLKGLSGIKKQQTALLIENQRKHFAPLTEMTKLLNIGHIDKVTFPTIRAVYPNLIANELVSVQPLTGPVGLAFYFDVIYGSNKGAISAGTAMFDSRTGPYGDESYSSDSVVNETCTLAANNVNHTLAYGPIRPGTVTVVFTSSVAGTVTATDDGNGGFLFSPAYTATATIDYATGAVVIDHASETISIARATYRYDSEGADNTAQVDLQLTSVPITAIPHKLRSRISWEALMQMESVNGMSAAAEVAQAMTEGLKHGIDRKIINDLSNGAGAGSVVWDRTVPFGVSWTEHKQSLVDAMSAANNLVFRATKRGNTNWIVAGIGVCDVVETLPNFVPAVNLAEMNPNTGVQFIGTLAGRWRVYKDPFLQSNKWVQGYKGARITDAGYAYCPWIPVFTSPEIMLDDMIRRQAMATMYGSKMMNSRFYCTGIIVN